jgi:hypothetical protein
MSRARITAPLGLAVACALAAVAVFPRAFEAQRLLSIQDDPAAIADRAVTQSLNVEVAAREIRAALEANDAELAQSFVDLAGERQIPVETELLERVKQATAEASGTVHTLGSFARGFVTGEPEDVSGLVGTAVGDLFVFGDIRDAVREGARLASGEQADELILGLACVGIAITAGTYATVGLGAPARMGVTLIKAARKTGRLGGRLAAWMGRSLRDVVDFSAASRALKVSEPAMAARAAREVVKVEKAQDLARLVGDVGRVQAKAGTQAALDGLRLAEGPRDMSRISRLAVSKGSKTRAILKLAGRGAILLLVGTFNLAIWVFSAIITVFGFVSALKRMCERATERYCARRKLRRARQLDARRKLSAAKARASLALREELPTPRSSKPSVSDRKPRDMGLLEYLARCPSRSPEFPARDAARQQVENAVLSFRHSRLRAA